MKAFTVFLVLVIGCGLTLGDNIVFFFGLATYSHRITVWPLVEGLAEKGHNVTFISAFPPKEPNPKVHELTPKSLKKWFESWDANTQMFDDRETGQLERKWFQLPNFGQTLCELFLSDSEVIEWIQNTPVDLVIIDSLFNECGYAIAAKNKAKHLIFSSSSLCPWHYDIYGISVESSWIPDMIYHFPQNMTFMEKVHSTLNPVYWEYIRKWKVIPGLEAVMKEKLNIEVNLDDMEKNTSLILFNSHFSEEFARSLPPLVIPVGGMHCKDKISPLSKDLEKFINKPGSKGFIYISFGSAAKMADSPMRIRNAFFNTIKKLKDIQFVWKWEGDFPKEAHPNILFIKWAPQQDILAHPKIKAFMTHSGLLSIQEAIYYGVPLISMPLFAEQDYNAERIHRMEHGIRLEVVDITQEQLESAIHKILNNQKYSNNMKLLSKRFKDRPMKPVDTALWWTEYVLRQDDSYSLSPLSRYQTWYQRRLLDVWGFVAIVLLLAFSIVTYIVFLVANCLYNRSIAVSIKEAKNKLKTN